MLTRRCGMCWRRRCGDERLAEELARRDAWIEELSAELAVLQRLVLGRLCSAASWSSRAACWRRSEGGV
jgi:hypothetical protein